MKDKINKVGGLGFSPARGYHATGSNFDAFRYFKSYSIKEDRLTYVNAHLDFSILINQITEKYFSRAQNAYEIRVMYDPKCAQEPVMKEFVSEERLKQCAQWGQEFHKEVAEITSETISKNKGNNEVSIEELQNQLAITVRTLMKGSARDRQNNFEEGREYLNKIHATEKNKHGDFMGAPHSELIKKVNPSESAQKKRNVNQVLELYKKDPPKEGPENS
ncbi:TPA: hypothetical protein JBE16_00270 [Legionella pneumophila subsp. pneumophila]|uniref:hypothetical protein n=1 Tax=Legionella sp. PATHC039 TaxID=2992042 RepID=UPI001A22995A|nr:hypothetical protein [Legionella sp. PATHC039]MCW8394800.1 hypothetical protein [Legionella sp. PATHC039]HAT8857396.1 hypothetical protein [Legionella pneumophila subsp. pneumophila]HAT9649434.1 hypothetical protein [Legionella pneumophila subsp. pneumophila]HAT9918698.1 hypothetical protein [Legionella pneumophila subsp. pneumophila]